MMFKLSGSLSHAHWDHLHADPASCCTVLHGVGMVEKHNYLPSTLPWSSPTSMWNNMRRLSAAAEHYFTASRWKFVSKKASAQQPKRALACTGTVKTITVNDKRRMGSASPIICSHHHWSSTDAWIYSYCLMKPRIEFTFPDAQMILRCIHFWPIYSTHLCMLC